MVIKKQKLSEDSECIIIDGVSSENGHSVKILSGKAKRQENLDRDSIQPG